MLTADLVHTTRRGARLYVTKLRGARLQRANDLAEAMVQVVQGSPGAMRGELVERLRALEASPRDRKLVRGLARLVLQRCELEVAAAVEPIALRREVFVAAAAARKAGHFDRQRVLAEVGAQHDIDPEAVDTALFADLKDTHRLVSWLPLTGEQLVEQYELAQAQAVLLRAVKLVVTIEASDPQAYRRLFRRLKFHRLLWRTKRLDAGYELTIDGPFSMFSQSTRYGLQLAMVLPVLREMDRFELVAEVQWGRARTPLTFRLEGKGKADGSALRLADDVQRLLDDLAATKGPWTCSPATEIIDVPGAGVIVPDLQLRRAGAAPVFVEVLGYWSRPAVWRRIELVQDGLAVPLIFVLSNRLRVSEEALGDDLPAALYVYKGVISAKTVLRKAAQLVAADH